MNQELQAIAREAGAPEDMMNALWFNVFCMKFAHLILLAAEEEFK